ncbi:MAG TPA: site-2 protease family protein [Thermoplasmata archaeon]|nr:site-2 protease family protein [Thermoplasmata archaeon]
MRFPVYESRITPRSLVLLVHVDPSTLEERFDGLRRELWTDGYVPQIRREGGEHLIEIVRRPNRSPWGSWSNLVLLAITVGTTVTAGALLWLAWRGGSHLAAADFAFGGFYFALPLLGILGLHELAHYVVARRHHVEASLPYFIPVPPPFLLFGTFGAFISLREPIPSKKALLDIGASGPLAGFALAIPVTFGGLLISAHSAPLALSNCGPTVLGVSYGNLEFGASLFWQALSLFVPASALANLHPLALAGWVGLLVTAINLLPAGQLDGGHVFRALLGDRSRWVSYLAVALLFLLGLVYQGWILFGVLIFVLGVRHPPPLNDLSPLDGKRWAVGGMAVAILLSGFVIVPIAAPTNAFGVAAGSVDLSGTTPSGFAMADNVSVVVHDRDFAPHGYAVAGGLTSVVASVNGTPVLLTGAREAAFESNTTWIVSWADGRSWVFDGSGGFALPSDQLLSVGAGGSSTFHVLFENRERAVVSFSVSVREVCSGGLAPKDVGFNVG